MNIVKRLDQYDNNYLHFCEPIKNNIMNHAKFIRILYSTPYFILNGIYLDIQFNEMKVEKYYNKYKFHFYPQQHKEMIEQIKQVEETILQKANIRNKTPMFRMVEQLKLGHIKIFSDVPITNNNHFLIKISGIWETEIHYGITFKFSKIIHP